MPTILQDCDFFRIGLQELETYLLSRETYWALSGSRGLPRLTIGGLLLARKRLQARPGRLPSSVNLEALDEALESARRKWRSAWEKKAVLEFRSRLTLWKNYLLDVRQSPEADAADYPHQVQGRVMLHLLLGELPGPAGDLAGLDDLDKVLRGIWRSGPFLWESALASSFPESDYWYLYGKLRSA